MDVSVSSRNIELTEALRDMTTEKIGRLGRFLDGMERAEVHFFEERNPRIADKDVCEVTMDGHGHHVRAKVAAADPFAAVDAAVNKLEQQLHKLKTKLVGRSHPRRRDDQSFPPLTLVDLDSDVAYSPAVSREEDEDVGRDGYRIVKSKRFTMKPMTPEEAVMQMELLGHSFYFFSNAETGRAAVVYHRSAGDVGLIDEAG
ncbi:MAG TPA: ribosome-associated translation inhibitor RaiA [Acidimicrobiales bacterium]|nr:ribosome-associated translation inhibitor RaiA [Acidimicrobiales bacterium]